MSDTPVFTLTRTIVRFKKGDEVVREVVIEPGDKFNVKKLAGNEKLAFMVYLVESGRLSDVEELLQLPPYLKLVVPKTVGDEVSRAYLMSVLSQAFDPDYRKKMLIRYLESNRGSIISEAVSRGVDQSLANSLFNRLIEEVRSLSTLEEVVAYEKKDPVQYILALASSYIAITQ